MQHPMTCMMDIFKMGISDLSWGFNGNILLASSHDGQVLLIHYQPGILGKPLTELEKQLIIEKRYGSSVLQEYKQNHRVQDTDLPSGLTNGVTNSGVNMNMTADEIKEQQKSIQIKPGKKKIVPVTVRSFEGGKEINPFANPFHSQMLRDDTANNNNGQEHV